MTLHNQFQLFDMLDPRLVISAHTHHGCYKVHENGVPEWTVASYSWRNKPNPTFLLVKEVKDFDVSVHVLGTFNKEKILNCKNSWTF